MNLRDLRYLVSVAELEHFGKAALANHVSQPTLSQQIKKLEDSLGVAVFERDKRQVRLTAIGAELVIKARRVLAEADAMSQLAKSAADPRKGDLSLGAFPTLGPYYFPLVLPPIRKHLPDIRLFLIEEKTEVLVQQLLHAELDAAVLATPIRYEGLDAVPLFSEEFYLAVHKGHALAKRKSLDIDELQGLSLMLLEDGHCLREQALEVCQLSGANESATYRASSLEVLRQMVSNGFGATLMPQIAQRQQDSNIRYIPIKQAPKRQIALVYRSSTARRQTMALLVQVLRQAYK